MPAYQPDVAARFWSKVNKNGPAKTEELGSCWLWCAQINNHGYGVFRLSRPRRSVFAHRYAWEMINGPIPEDMKVLHRCDTPACVRHLFIGTFTDNMQDAAKKGRINTSKLSPRQIGILKDNIHGHQSYGWTIFYAELFGVHRSTIRRAAKSISFKLLS